MKSLTTTFIFISLTIGFLSAQDIYVSNRDSDSVKKYNGITGAYIEDAVSSGSGGLDNPQEVLFHTDGDLLVTGINNTQIKKYNGQTGGFIENWSTGYPLSRPTKMAVGPDGYLYVSQWGLTQNKVVRFNFDTGAFVDEFTSIGVPQGCGMDWDDEGNLLVTGWGEGNNGDVKKFNVNGDFVGSFISAPDVQGPVGIWIAENGDIFVIDWTLGSVIKFDSNGANPESFITGMTNTEGNVFDSDGNIYLCDWSLDRVNKYSSEGSFIEIFASGGGMSTPNSITFGPPPVTAIEDPGSGESFSLLVVPNPVSDKVTVKLILTEPGFVTCKVFDDIGQLANVIFNDQLPKGEHTFEWTPKGLKRGVYIVQIEVNGKTFTEKFIVLE